MHVCMYVCTHACMYVCMYTYIYKYVKYISLSSFTYIYIFTATNYPGDEAPTVASRAEALKSPFITSQKYKNALKSTKGACCI